jgi:hypothetical protein
MQSMQSMQSNQVSVRHTHITDLVAEQRAECESLRTRYENLELALRKVHIEFSDRIYSEEMELHLNTLGDEFCKLYNLELSQLSKKHEEEKDALRAALWQRAENAFAVACKLKYDERRETMEAFMKSRSMPVEKLDERMTEYTKWLITFEKMNKKGPMMNRWELMTAFASTPHFA